MRVLATPEELSLGLRELEGAPRYYVDTEFESSKRGKQLSLIQLSRGDEVFIIDALQLPSLADLEAVIFAPSCEWVLHAGLQDVELLLAEFDRASPPALFDTQVVWSLTGPEASVSLAFLQFRVLGVRSSKGYQADDWMRRPLPRAQLEYAASDIVHLPALERELRQRARDLGREHVISDACRELLVPEPPEAALLTFESFRNAWQLDAAGQNALRALIEWYNGLAPGELSVQSRTLLAIASRMPANMRELSRIKGIGPSMAEKMLGERKKAPFKDWNDLTSRVKGVGDASASKFSQNGLTVNGSAFTGPTAAGTAKAATAAGIKKKVDAAPAAKK